MSEQIKEGDLVAVTKQTPCCGSLVGMGSVYTVLHMYKAQLQCLCCGEILENGTQAVQAIVESPQGYLLQGHMIERLQRIPPLEELEGARSQEKLWEPA